MTAATIEIRERVVAHPTCSQRPTGLLQTDHTSTLDVDRLLISEIVGPGCLAFEHESDVSGRGSRVPRMLRGQCAFDRTGQGRCGIVPDT